MVARLEGKLRAAAVSGKHASSGIVGHTRTLGPDERSEDGREFEGGWREMQREGDLQAAFVSRTTFRIPSKTLRLSTNPG